MDEALAVLEDALVAGDNPESALATVADDFGVNPAALAAAFREKYGKSYLVYASED